mmetsp:Transcript_24398/g.49423  ORF Transcript_24398/g.49423 Transcript_24398/m.49423 type:complete len:232 (+) Transcript_24398:135-830(+)
MEKPLMAVRTFHTAALSTCETTVLSCEGATAFHWSSTSLKMMKSSPSPLGGASSRASRRRCPGVGVASGDALKNTTSSASAGRRGGPRLQEVEMFSSTAISMGTGRLNRSPSGPNSRTLPARMRSGPIWVRAVSGSCVSLISYTLRGALKSGSKAPVPTLTPSPLSVTTSSSSSPPTGPLGMTGGFAIASIVWPKQGGSVLQFISSWQYCLTLLSASPLGELSAAPQAITP